MRRRGLAAGAVILVVSSRYLTCPPPSRFHSPPFQEREAIRWTLTLNPTHHIHSVHGLGLGKRSKLMRALSDPTAQLNLILLNEQARVSLIQGGEMGGAEQALLEGAGILAGSSERSHGHANGATEESSPLWWSYRLLAPSAWWGESTGKREDEEEEEHPGLFFASLAATPDINKRP